MLLLATDASPSASGATLVLYYLQHETNIFTLKIGSEIRVFRSGKRTPYCGIAEGAILILLSLLILLLLFLESQYFVV